MVATGVGSDTYASIPNLAQLQASPCSSSTTLLHHEVTDTETEAKIVDVLCGSYDYIQLLQELTKVNRQSLISDSSRQETAAEHIAFVAQICVRMYRFLARDVRQTLDLGRALQLIFVHDTPEAIAGDAYAYAPGFSGERKREKEMRAALVIQNMLTRKAGQAFFSRWTEYEERDTCEAIFAKACDQLAAALQNLFSGGRLWLRDKHTIASFLKDTRVASEFDPVMADLVDSILDIAICKGFLT